jgi:hypothetical protein
MAITEDAYPGAYHPYYAGKDHEGLWRTALKNGVVRMFIPPRLTATFAADPMPDTSVEINTLDLHVQRVAAPVPYVGQRRYALWPVLRDQYGRCIGPVWDYQVEFHDDPNDFLNALPEQPHALWCRQCQWWHLSTELLTWAGRRRFIRCRPYLEP